MYSTVRTIAISAGITVTLLASRQSVAQLGVPITPPMPLNTNATSDSGWEESPHIANDGLGNWVAVWHSNDSHGGTIGLDFDILFSRSTDNGMSWTPPLPLNTNAATDTNTSADRYARIASDGSGNWVAVWFSRDPLGGTFGTDEDIFVSRSADNGASWTPPIALNTNAATDSGPDAVPRIATDGSGNWVAVWGSKDPLEGTIGTDWDMLVARSTDNGATWTGPTPLNTRAATDSANDGLAEIATDRLGNWLVVLDSTDPLDGTIGFDTDILVSRSTDNGATWTALVPLNTNASTDDVGDYEPKIVTDGLGTWVAVWVSGQILVSRSTDNGATWTAPTAIGTGLDWKARLATDGSGNWVAVWFSWDSLGGMIGTDMDILVSRSTDNGVTWTAPVPLNTNAAIDSGFDEAPWIATDGSGNWVGVWYSDDSLGGTIGTDWDILVARFKFAGTPIPTVSKWGMVVVLLLLLSAGTIVLNRRHHRAA